MSRIITCYASGDAEGNTITIGSKENRSFDTKTIQRIGERSNVLGVVDTNSGKPLAAVVFDKADRGRVSIVLPGGKVVIGDPGCGVEVPVGDDMVVFARKGRKGRMEVIDICDRD